MRTRYKIKGKEIIAQTLRWQKKNQEKWKEYLSVYNRTHKKERRIKKILRLYNLTEDKYNKIFASQNYKCAICGKEGFDPCIDHDHNTGTVRGILCMNCNCALGALKDDVTVVERVLFYLKKCKST